MSAELRHALNSEVATAKVIDGEAIIINVVSGRYYSLEGAGGLAWTLLAGGATFAEAAGVLGDQYEVDSARAQADLERLAAELLDEQLLVRAEGAAPAAVPEAPAQRAPYQGLRLVTFSDMEDLLAIDPPLPPTDAELWPAQPDPH